MNTRKGVRTEHGVEKIQFAFGDSSMGHVLVAASAVGLCSVLLGDDTEALLGELNRRFPRAALEEDSDGLEALSSQVIRFVESPASGLDVPLDLRGTAFQRAVWQALREIPAGTTASYTSIAIRIGQPSAVRAVAGACAANALAVVVPCHRAVRSDGSLSGYRWGVERKRALLDRESGSLQG